MALAGVVVTAAARASARCPKEDPGDTVCEPLVSMLMPSVAGVAYFPSGAGGPYMGGGVELSLLSWASNNDAFGPSHGRIRANVAYLASPETDHRVLLYRFGGVVSFEGNASRRFLIPYWGASVGGLWATDFGQRAIADASVGMFLLYTRDFVLDAEGGVVLPFTAVDKLLGPRAQLTAAVALW